MDPLSQIIAGIEAAWWLVWSVPAVPMAEDPEGQVYQIAVGGLAVTVICAWMLAS